MKKGIKRLFLLCAVTLMLLLMALSANAALVGDVTNNDNDVTAADARIILRASVGLETLTDAQKLLADTNADGKISAADARNALRMSVGLEEKLHYYEKEVLLAPTCTDIGKGKATCTQCTDAYEYDIPALGHDFGEAQIITQVTCDTDGLEKYTCARCSFVDERLVKKGHTPDIPAATCTEDQLCTRGNHIMAAKLGHTTSWGVCGNCKIYITDKHAAAAATVKAKFTEAKTVAANGYAIINKSVGAASWLGIYAKEAKPEYEKAKAAYEAAVAACGDIQELAAIKVKLQKNVENVTGIINQCQKIITEGGNDPSSRYIEFITPIDDLYYFNSDCVDNTDRALTKLILW